MPVTTRKSLKCTNNRILDTQWTPKSTVAPLFIRRKRIESANSQNRLRCSSKPPTSPFARKFKDQRTRNPKMMRERAEKSDLWYLGCAWTTLAARQRRREPQDGRTISVTGFRASEESRRQEAERARPKEATEDWGLSEDPSSWTRCVRSIRSNDQDLGEVQPVNREKITFVRRCFFLNGASV